MRVALQLGLQGPWQHRVCKDTDSLCHRSYGPIRIFFQASCSWRSEGLFGQSFSVAPPIQELRGLLCLGSFSVVLGVRHREGPSWLGSYSVVQCVRHSRGQPLCCSAAIAAMVLAHPLCMTQQYCLASMAAWLSSTGISRSLLPHIPSVRLSLQSTAALAVGLLHNPYSPAPSCCAFQGTRVPVQGLYGCSKDCLILIPFRLSQISCFTLRLKCFSSDSDNCHHVGTDPCFSSPSSQVQVQSY